LGQPAAAFQGLASGLRPQPTWHLDSKCTRCSPSQYRRLFRPRLYLAGRAFISVFLACFKDYKPYLRPGEVATIRVMAADRAQARTIFRYVGALLRETQLLAPTIVRETATEFELSTRVVIEIGAADFKAVRSYTFAAVLADEFAFWSDENSANPDEEVLTGVRPAMATIPSAMLLCASSPYARKGALWGCIPAMAWPGRCAGIGLAGEHPQHEPERAGRVYRARTGKGSCPGIG
jgi:hypothetical protein